MVTAIICNLPPTIFLLVICGFLGVSVLLGTCKTLSSMNQWIHCASLHCCLWMFFTDSKTESSAKRTAKRSPLSVELSAAFLPSRWTSLVAVVLKGSVLWPKSGSFSFWSPFFSSYWEFFNSHHKGGRGLKSRSVRYETQSLSPHIALSLPPFIWNPVVRKIKMGCHLNKD